MGNIRLYGSTSGYTELAPPAVAPDGVLSLPSGTGTLATQAYVDTAETDAIAASGLRHINTTTFTAQSNVSINNVFTSTYDNYFLQIVGSTSEGGRPQLRFRVGGVDAATNYNRQGLWGVGGTATAFGATGNTYGILTLNQEAGDFAVSAQIFRPAIAVATIFTTVGYTVEQSAELSGQRHTTATAYDGFSVIPESGTITGTLRVYGYKNS